MLYTSKKVGFLILVIIIMGLLVYYYSTYLPSKPITIVYVPTNVTNITNIPAPDTTLINVLLLLLSSVVIITVSIFIYIVIKRGYIPKILGRSYIEVYIIGKDRRIRRYKKAIKNTESKLTPVINKRKYLMNDKRMFLSRSNPSWIYREGNPKPLEIDEDVLNVNISDHELNNAIESKVVEDLLKLSYVGLEKLVVILILASIGISTIGIYYMFTISTDVSAIIDYLISQQSSSTDAVIVPNIP